MHIRRDPPYPAVILPIRVNPAVACTWMRRIAQDAYLCELPRERVAMR